MPEPSSTELDAEFYTSSVKVSFTNPQSDLSGRIYSETYLIKGFLHPKADPMLTDSMSFIPEHGDRNIACGPLKMKMKVHTKKNDHPMGSAISDKALVYVIQKDEFTVKVLGSFPTRLAIDGQWIGGNHNNSYFYFPVSSGEHQVCAEWEIEFSHHVLPVSFAKFKAKAGETYFMQSRVVFAGLDGERSITLEPLGKDAADKLIESSAYSQQN